MREKIMVDYISSISSDGVPYVVNGEVYADQLETLPEYELPVLKSLNAKSTASLLNDLHDHAVNCDDGKMIELVADVMQRVKELETKLEHIRHDLDEK